MMEQLYTDTEGFEDTAVSIAPEYEQGESKAIINAGELTSLSVRRMVTGSFGEHAASSQDRLLLFLTGSGTAIVNGISFSFRHGDMMRLDAGARVTFPDPSHGVEVYVLSFGAELLNTGLVKHSGVPSILKQKSEAVPSHAVPAPRFSLMQDLFMKLEHELKSHKAFHTEMAQLSFVELIFQAYRICKTTGQEFYVETRSRKLSRQFIVMTDENYLEMRTVQEYADRLFVSAKHLSEVIKAETGHSPLHHIHERIFREAQYWLTNSDLTIKEISEKMGFDTQSHFSRSFKQFTGHNPSSYQKM